MGAGERGTDRGWILSRCKLSDVTATTATIAWSTVTPASSTIWVGRSKACNDSATFIGGQRTRHQIALTLLRPATLYYFKVSSTAGNKKVESEVRTFTTTAG